MPPVETSGPTLRPSLSPSFSPTIYASHGVRSGGSPVLTSTEVAVIVSTVVSFLVCFACFYFRRHWKKFRGHPAHRPHWETFTDDRAGVGSHSVGEGGMQEIKDWVGGKQEIALPSSPPRVESGAPDTNPFPAKSVCELRVYLT